MLHPMPYRFYQPPNKALQQTQPSVHVATEPTTEGIFFDIVEARTRDHRPLLVTTNHSGAAMEKLFSENIAACMSNSREAQSSKKTHETLSKTFIIDTSGWFDRGGVQRSLVRRGLGSGGRSARSPEGC